MGTVHLHQWPFHCKPTGIVLLVAAVAVTLFWRGNPLDAQTPVGCGTASYRIVSQSRDAVLKRGWEWRQECDHPDWPLRLIAMGSAGKGVPSPGTVSGVERKAVRDPEMALPTVLVNAGDVVRLWMQDDAVRIEMSGVVERSAHLGDRVIVQVTRQDDEVGLTVQRIPGRVSGANEVEIER